MSTTSKYYWDGVDVSEITATTNTNTLITSNFTNFPANLSIIGALTTEPDGLVTNAGNFSSISYPNTSYQFYNDDEEENAPQFLAQGNSIFTTTYLNNNYDSRILVRLEQVNNNSGTITIPDWVNGVKIWFLSLKGIDGNGGNGVAASTENTTNHDDYDVKTHRDEHKHYDGGWVDHFHHNKDDHHNIHHHNHNIAHLNWEAQDGGAGGIGGTGKVGWYYKAILFDAGTNNEITYSISSSEQGVSTVNVKQGSVVKAEITYSNGENGGDGGDATNSTTNNANHNNATDNTEQRGDENSDHHNNDNHNEREGSKAGDPGTDGTSGSATLTNDFKYLYYNSSLTTNNNPTQLTIAYFRFKSD